MDGDADSCEGLGSGAVPVGSERDGGGSLDQDRSEEVAHNDGGGEKLDDRNYVEVLHSACMDCNDDWRRYHH